MQIQRKTIMSKILKDFKARRATPAGDLDQMSQNYIKNNWSNIEQCILNGQDIYMLADTQAGKTRYKLWLADYALSKGIVDNVVISTTNLTGAMTQMFDRAVDWGKQIGRQVKSTTDKSTYMVKGDIFVNMTNANRTNRIDAIVADAEKTAKQTKRPVPRILVIIDEGEEFHQCTQSSQCDIALTNLLLSRKGTISTVKVSATLLSHLIIHGPYSYELGHLTKEQVYRIPNHPDYKGLNIPNFIEPVLSIESNFSSDTYTNSANLRNTINPQRVVNEVETLISNNSLVQIGNVVFGKKMSGHVKVAGMITRAFQNKGRTVTVWDDEDLHQLNTSSEVVVIVHNGHARDLTVAEKLTAIAHGWDRTKLKAILIISKMMTGKSITVECDHWLDPMSPEFGFYANFTAYYGPGKENITTAIQAMRCTGIRPALKKNVMWTTDDTKQDIENYRDQITKFIAHLNTVGVMNQTQILTWVQGTRPFAKANIQKKYIHTANSTKKFSSKELSVTDYKDLLNQGVPQIDGHYSIPKKTYEKLTALPNRELAAGLFNFIKTKGFNDMTFGKFSLRSRRHANYKDESSAQQAFTRGDDLQGLDSLINMHLYELNGKFFVYAFNNIRPANRPSEYIKLDIEFSANCQPLIFAPKVHHKTDSYVYKVI
jgi:hypothetical protein